MNVPLRQAKHIPNENELHIAFNEQVILITNVAMFPRIYKIISAQLTVATQYVMLGKLEYYGGSGVPTQETDPSSFELSIIYAPVRNMFLGIRKRSKR